VSGRHDEDLELARQCAAGDEAAWDRFVRDYRPVLYRAADALEPGGGARDLADSLYADLYGIQKRGAERTSLLRYFEGRSSLATWLRAVLAQRYVDRVRERRGLEPLPDEDQPAALRAPEPIDPPDPYSARDVARLRQALERAIARLDSRDRLRLGCYYVQQLTLAETGRLLKEHEATASRKLDRTRAAIRTDVERQLREDFGMTGAQMTECFKAATGDAGQLDLDALLNASARKKSERDRSE
jgi:RNA polymerase sigma factor (sigma-70 family)